ncbi:hypothetical protein SK128_002059, partial [Halocaridina rubra]
MSEGRSWSATKNGLKIGSSLPNENAPVPCVTYGEMTHLLEKAFSAEKEIIQRLREEAQQRKPAAFHLRLTVLEAEIQHQIGAK